MAVRERFSRHDVEDHKRAIFKAREDFFAPDRSTMGTVSLSSVFTTHSSDLSLLYHNIAIGTRHGSLSLNGFNRVVRATTSSVQ
jgi:hypothetical protein